MKLYRLRPCPICAEQDALEVYVTEFGQGQVSCGKCMTRVFGYDQRASIEKWNTRNGQPWGATWQGEERHGKR